MSRLYYQKAKALLLLLVTSQAMAFDPFTILGAGGSAVKGLGDSIGLEDVVSGASDLVDGLDAASEFTEELGLRKRSSEEDEVREYVNEIREIEGMLYDVGYTQSEVEAFTYNVRRGTNSFAQNVRQLTNIIRRVKRVSSALSKLGNLVGLSGGSAEKARAESDARNIRVLKDIQSEMIKSELQRLRDKARAQLVYKNIKKGETESRKNFLSYLKGKTAVSGTDKVSGVVFQTAWTLLFLILMVSGLLFACGLALAGRLVFVSALSGGVFLLILSELVSMIQRGLA